jgi:hypothetical protein
MSDNYITFIPEDPTLVPEAARQAQARDRFAQIAPEADEINLKISESVAFFNCGGNFERILCPACHAEISVEWWQDRMHDDYSNGFKLAKYKAPCCKAACTLHELIYEWPQGFGRFALEAMNPNIGRLDDDLKKEFEEILGTELRVIYQHI